MGFHFTANLMPFRDTKNVGNIRQLLSKQTDSGTILAEYKDILTDPFIARYLLANDHVLTVTTAAIIKHLHWRKDFCLDSILVEPAMIQLEHKLGREFQWALPEMGRPTLVWHIANHDPKAIAPKMYTRFFVYMMEKGIRQYLPPDEAHTSLDDGRIDVFLDLADMSVRRNADLSMMKLCAPIIQDNFPERQNRTCAYPVSTPIIALWKLGSPLLDKGTREKIVLLPKSSHQKASALLGSLIDQVSVSMDSFSFSSISSSSLSIASN